jgi:NADPH:quinone reductase-like Zn-dependent oxidoreductase
MIGPGPISQLRIVEKPDPIPAAGEVLIDVEAAGVIFADVLVRRGDAIIMPAFPYYPGREVVGRVAALGSGVAGVQIGDRVLAMLLGGGYAERAVVAVQPYRMPKGGSSGRVLFPVAPHVPADQAISHGMNLRMALLMMFRAAPRAGQRVLIHSAAGGVGAHLSRLCKDRGCEVLAVVGSAEKAAYCLENGADFVINHREVDYVEAARGLTGGSGVDLSINMVNGPTLARDADLLAPEGTLLIAGVAQGLGSITPSVHAKSLNYKHFTSYWHLGRAEDVEATDIVAKELQGPGTTDRTICFPMDDVGDAHALLESGESVGKLVLLP